MISTTDGSDVTTGTPVVYRVGDDESEATGSGTKTHKGHGTWSYAVSAADSNFNHVAFTMVLTGAVSQTVNVYPTFPQTGDSFGLIGTTGSGLTSLATQASVNTIDDFVDGLETSVASLATASALATVDSEVGTILGRVLGTIAAGTHVAQTGDSYARIGATGSGLTTLATQASVNTIDDFLDTEIAAIKAKTDSLTFTVAGDVDCNVQTWKGSAAADLSSLAQASVCSETRLSELDAGTAGKMANQVDIIQTDTTTDIPATITTMQGNVTNILEDTATTIPGAIAALNDITVAEIIAGIADGTYDLQEMLRIMFAALAGKSAGGGTSTITFRDAADSKNRISATVDANGNRTAITVNGE